MKKLFYTLTMTVVLVTLFATAAHAQTSNPQTVIANIPFAFNVGKTSLPAGKYSFTVVNPSSDRKILEVKNSAGHASALVQTNNVNGILADNAKLVFERYDDQYFFTQAQWAGDATSLAAIRSKSERKHLIAGAAKKTVVVISIG